MWCARRWAQRPADPQPVGERTGSGLWVNSQRGRAGVAHLAERDLPKVEVAGSSPVSRSTRARASSVARQQNLSVPPVPTFGSCLTRTSLALDTRRNEGDERGGAAVQGGPGSHKPRSHGDRGGQGLGCKRADAPRLAGSIGRNRAGPLRCWSRSSCPKTLRRTPKGRRRWMNNSASAPANPAWARAASLTGRQPNSALDTFFFLEIDHARRTGVAGACPLKEASRIA